MKVLFVGDIHNHYYMFKQISRLDSLYWIDKIIFLGDYVDDWYTTNNESIETLEQIIELKKSNPDKYTMCLGNHELSYLGYPCSGHQFNREAEVTSLLRNNIDLFDLYTTIKLGKETYYCSHAGFLNDYVDFILGNNYNKKLQNMNKDKLSYLGDLRHCSMYRGGSSEFSSFVWADAREFKTLIDIEEKLTIPNQIVGHCPVKTITNLKYNNMCDLWYTDTHSTYSDGTEYGDKSYLLWHNDKFEIVY